MITERLLRQTHSAYLSGMPLKELARAYGVSYNKLSKALKKWRIRHGKSVDRKGFWRPLAKAVDKALKARE